MSDIDLQDSALHCKSSSLSSKPTCPTMYIPFLIGLLLSVTAVVASPTNATIRRFVLYELGSSMPVLMHIV